MDGREAACATCFGPEVPARSFTRLASVGTVHGGAGVVTGNPCHAASLKLRYGQRPIPWSRPSRRFVMRCRFFLSGAGRLGDFSGSAGISGAAWTTFCGCLSTEGSGRCRRSGSFIDGWGIAALGCRTSLCSYTSFVPVTFWHVSL